MNPLTDQINLLPKFLQTLEYHKSMHGTHSKMPRNFQPRFNVLCLRDRSTGTRRSIQWYCPYRNASWLETYVVQRLLSLEPLSGFPALHISLPTRPPS